MSVTPDLEQISEQAQSSPENGQSQVFLKEVEAALNIDNRQVKSKIRWEWNLPLLLTTLAILGLSTIIGVLIHSYQAKRVAEGLSNLAKKAMAEGDYTTEIKWLNQLVTFDFRYDRALERLAIATNNSVDSPLKVDQARQALMRALTTLDEAEDAERIQKLRRLLIQRLLEMPAAWAPEAEKQVILLDANQDDPDAIRWLALSLFIQVENGEWRARDKSRYDKNKDYWNWMSRQNVGHVLEAAEAINPEAIDLKIALLSSYVERPQLFDTPITNESKKEFIAKASRVVEDLKKYDDGRAQWAAIAFTEKIDKQKSEYLLKTLTVDAVKRLKSHPVAILREKRKDIRPAMRYWDMTIAMSQAAKSAQAGNFTESDALYQKLLEVEAGQLPETQYADLHLQFARSLWQRQQSQPALEVLAKGCKDTSFASSLELWELIAVIQSNQGTKEQATKAIDDLNQAIQSARDLYLASPIRDSVREQELKKLASIRWNANLLKFQLDLRSNTQWTTIQELEKLLQSQQDIPGSLKFQAKILLASTYNRLAMWDLEANTLEDSLSLLPDDKQFRKRVAQAWLRAGSLARAETQLRLADDGSFDDSLQHLQVMIGIQQVLPPSLRQMDRVRQLSTQTQQRLAAENNAGKVNDKAWVFELIEASHIIDSLESKKIEFGVEGQRPFQRLIKTYPDNLELQAVAAQTFSAQGDIESASLALNNLERHKKKSPEIWFTTNLRILLQRKQYTQAKEFILNATTDKLLPEQTLHRLAADAYFEAGDLQSSCEILLKSKESDDTSYLFTLANQLLQLTLEQEPQATSEPVLEDFTAELEKIAAKVRKLDGDQSLLVAYLDAALLLKSARQNGKSEEFDQATRLIVRVLDVRPRWIDALRLAGDIRAAAKDPEEAVIYYRRALTEGDLRVATVFLLAQQLSQLGKFGDAEIEFQRISHLSIASRALSDFAVSLEQSKGNDFKALELARAATERHPEDSAAWLLNALAAARRYSFAETPDLALLDEAETCFEKANELAKGSDPAIWIAQFRFTSRYRTPEDTESLIEKMRSSSLSEKSRGLLSAQAYGGLYRYSEAIEVLLATAQKLPYDVDVLLALSDAYRFNGQPTQSLETLDKAYRLNPRRSDIARSLAVQLATNVKDGNANSWSRIGTIVEGIDAESADARKLFYAFLLSTKGSEEQREQALTSLGQLLLSNDKSVVEDAIRLSISIHRRFWEEANESKQKDRMLSRQKEIQRLFDILWGTPERLSLVNDLYQHADFLLQIGETDRVLPLIEEFFRIAPTSPLLLNLRFQVAISTGKTDRIVDDVQRWMGDAQEKRNAPLLAEAGRLLSEKGFYDAAVSYLEAAYKIDSQWLRPLVVGLSRAGKLNDALNRCIDRYKAQPTADTASILADLAILSVGRSPLEPSTEQLIDEIIVRFPTNPKLLELVGTLRLFQQRYQEAFSLLIRAEKLAPQSVITLNNLAIVASEIPGREREGLARIERAIQLYGKTPDLLDTLGTVQLACGLAAQSETTLTISLQEKPDTRTLLHLLQTLQAQGKQSEIRDRLAAFKISQLQGIPLTAREQQAINELRKSYADLIPAEDTL